MTRQEAGAPTRPRPPHPLTGAPAGQVTAPVTAVPFSLGGAGHLSVVGEAQMRTSFDFAGAVEVHYISAVPEVGDYVTHLRELWVVRKIDEDGFSPMIMCELPGPEPSGPIP